MNKVDNWHEKRSKSVGGSDVAAVMGVSPWKTPVELWAEKRGKGGSRPTTVSQEWGNEKEEGIRAVCSSFLSRMMGRQVTLNETENLHFLENPNFPHLSGNLDGIIDIEGEGLAVLEIKTVHPSKWHTWEKSPPIHYIYQVQAYLALTGYNTAVIVALVGSDTMIYRVVKRDESIISNIKEKVVDFWEKVLTGTPPEITASSDNLIATFSGEGDITETPGQFLKNAFLNLQKKRLRLRDAQLMEKEAKEELMKLLNPKKFNKVKKIIFTCAEFSATVERRETVRIDTAKMRKDGGIDLTRYNKVSTSYVIGTIRDKGGKNNVLE